MEYEKVMGGRQRGASGGEKASGREIVPAPNRVHGSTLIEGNRVPGCQVDQEFVAGAVGAGAGLVQPGPKPRPPIMPRPIMPRPKPRPNPC